MRFIDRFSHNSTTDELDQLFSSINGVLFPGGGADIVQTPLFYSAQYLYNKALSAFDNGDYFPILGHCMGFEILATITSKDFNILSPVDAENISMALNLTEDWQSSRWFGSAPASVIDILTTQKVTINNHMFSVIPKGFNILFDLMFRLFF
jgi:gamma-glutamyl hydrolase